MNPDDITGSDDEEFDLPEHDPEADSGSKYRFTEGDYGVVLVNMKKEKSKAGNPMIVWTFRAEDDSGVDTTLRFDIYTALTPKAMWKVHEVARALGLRGEGETGAVRIKKAEALGRRALGDLKAASYIHEDKQKKISTRLQNVVPHPKGFGPVELGPDDLPF